ncbi:MAG: DNA-processing protein DprA [Gammaproteobacteria bacterium]|nr:DNA-processing protein DprA [Gammaproteobacteria bacterium]
MTADPWLSLLYACRGEPAWTSALLEAGSAEALYALDDRSLTRFGLTEDAVARLRRPDSETLALWRRWLDGAAHRRLVTLGSPEYPPLLASVADPPLALWTVGRRVDLLAAPQIAIVGSRNATRSGRSTATEFARYFAERGLTVTSGLASGIDTAGHVGALAEVGGTLAVFGCGIDIVFPRENRVLARDIAAAGLLLSEYPPGVPPLAHQFPARNRIIAGLSVGTLVVEAGRRSGALITARRAVEQGREVFAVPGSIHNPLSRGCHKLIRDGAKLVEEGADVLVELAPQLQLDAAPATPPARRGDSVGSTVLADEAYCNLLNSMEFEPVGIAELASRGGLTTAELSSMLLVLELEGFVEALPGGRYCRLSKRSR